MDAENKESRIEDIFLKSWHPYAWIAAIGFLLYFQIIFFDYTYFDDKILILDNYYFLNNLSNISEAFKQDVFRSHVGSYYRPMLTISFMFDAQISGILPWMYHLSNIIIHLGASCLLFLFLIRLKYSKQLSLFFAMLFTVHPVLTQAVCWIPGRNDPLVAVFILSAFIFLLDFIEKKKWGYFWLHLLFFAMALLTKELGFVMIGMIVLYLFTIIKEKLFSINMLALGIGWLVIIMGWKLARQAAFNYPLPLNISEIVTSIGRDWQAIFIFLGKILFPINLSVLPIMKDSSFAIYCGYITVALIIIVLLFTQKPRFSFIIFGASWFILFLIPSFLTSKISVVSFFVEHRIYLPLIGFIILVLEAGLVRKLETKKNILIVIGGILIVVLSILTFSHSIDFKGRARFWESAVKTSPHSPLARRNLGAMCYLDGIQLLDIADQEYRQVLQSNPKAQRDVKSRYFVEGMRLLNLAETEFRKSLELNPPEIMAHNNIGLIYMRKSMYKEAEEEFKKELEVNPSYDKGLFNLGLVYKELRQIKKAEAKELEGQGKQEEANVRLKEADGLLIEAEKCWGKTFQVNPDNVDAFKTLVMFYLEEKNIPMALRYANELQKRGIEIPPEIVRMLNAR